MRKFAYSKKNDVNEWFQLCRDAQKPYIVVTAKRLYSDVHWYYISFSQDAEMILTINSEEIIAGLIRIFKKYGNSKSKYETNGLVCTFKKIHTDEADHVANDIYDLISGSCK
ncbi:hypothetical protein [Edaphovirga cremea]|uniref:hypothetical protein n=1 Tax=Edaphovirga cremea TaxID=2267246 RepID=UPI003988DECB